ncbi:ABC-2 type transporter [Paenibacillus curdlanolyticus YK9]|uniref:Transport permease protein n=1 Tax=Paenibacillus curdlanolyticus YK9 TaxID=717606 RepID=E0I9Z0_9BACL|nr:ABC transporter permease [Paenibacillus curdlanolyticus]EFM10567.1 ABC-2 type transporter [Paenibacillus curdlanolyticus YK9]
MQSMLMHTKMELRLFFREIIGLFFVFVMPAACFYFFGKMFEAQQSDVSQYLSRYIPGMIGIVLFTSGFFIIGLQAVIDRERGVYKRLKGTPLHPAVIVQAILTKGLFAVFAGTLEIIIIARLAFHASLVINVAQFVMALLLSAGAFFAIGFVVASIAKKFQSAMAIGFVALYPMMFLSGATIPLESLPSSLQNVAALIPLKYAVHLLQNGWSGQLFTSSSLVDVIVLSVIVGLGIVISRKYFRWDIV